MAIPDATAEFWHYVGGALTLRPEAFAALLGDPDARRIAAAIAVLGGVSELLGQSVTLFLNQIRPRRFLLALALAALVFAANVMVWALGVWATSLVAPGAPLSFAVAVGIVTLGHAPLLLGFVVLTPYYGPPIQRGLEIWVVACIGFGLFVVTDWGTGVVTVAVAGGYVFRIGVKIVFGRLLGAVDDWLWRTALGGRGRLRAGDATDDFRARSAADARRWFHP